MWRAGANTTLAFVVVSLSLHGAAGVSLVLAPRNTASVVIAERARRAQPPIELSFEPAAAPQEQADAGANNTPATTPEAQNLREIERERRRREREREREREQAPDPFPTPEMVQTQPVAPPPNLQAVEQSQSNNQRSNNAEFLAERDNDVQEQTRAALRGTFEDSAHPQAGATQQRAPGSGSGSEDVHDARRNHEGADFAQSESHVGGRRAATQTREGASNSASTTTTAAPVNGAAQGAQGAQGAPGTNPSPQNQVFASSEGVWGQFALNREQRGVGGASGANGSDGHGGTGSSRAASRMGVAGRGAEGAMAALSPASADYAHAFGASVEQERREARERRTQARGETPTESWQQLRAGMENYVTSVRVGNQTALRTAASPFATYLSQMHHRIHRLFADGFLAGLDASSPDNPLNDSRLQSTVEIVLERDGRVSRVGIVRTSGSTMFDVAAMNSVRRSAPFGSAPDAIRSADGKVYIHWGFYRSDRQCGTFNAEPFILSAPNAGGSRERTTVIAPHVGHDR